MKTKSIKFMVGAIFAYSSLAFAKDTYFDHPRLLPPDTIPNFTTERLDFQEIKKQDDIRSRTGAPPRFAVPQAVSITPYTHGRWEPLTKKTIVWRLRIDSVDATNLNLGFNRWAMPKSGSMHISSSDGTDSMREFNASDNDDHGQLWTRVIIDNSLYVSIVCHPRDRSFIENNIELTSINRGYRGFGTGIDAIRSGSCNYDVNCAESEGWEDEIDCVAVISTGGSTFCSGFMVNNTSQDRTPLFMTANHCGVNSGNAASLVTYWNFQNPEDGPLDCPGASNTNGPTNQFNTGSTFLNSYSDSDYTIVLLDDSPNEEWEVSYCGWSAEDTITDYSVAIHHPSTDEKRWSIDYDPSEIYGYNQPGNTHLRILDWDLGTTEGGSSGSPLFNENHQVVGQLHGGYAACGNDDEDWYGRLAVSWNNGLQPILDPTGTGQLMIDTLPGRGMVVSPGGDTLHGCITGCTSPSPESVTYTVTNTSPVSINFEAYAGPSTNSFLVVNNGLGVNTTIFSGGSYSFDVSIDGENLTNGVYTQLVIMSDNTNDLIVERLHTLEIGISNFDITPDFGLEAGGPLGGPFNATQTYVIEGTRPTPAEIRVSASDSWISINGSNDAVFNLGEGETEDIIIGFSPQANELNNGLYNGTVSFENITTPGNGDTSRPVVLDVGRFTYAATDTPINIVDNSEFSSSLNVTDAYCIGDVNVEVDITHTYIGDLIIDLISPEGTIVRLHQQEGGGDDDIVGSYDDEGGDLVPFEPLSSLDGEGVSGSWSLRISDNAGADQGSLNSWRLKIASSGETCPPVAFGQEVSVDENGTIDVVLEGASPLGDELSFVITALPNEGSLLDGSIPINATPTTLSGDTVNYVASNGYVGPDDFRFRSQDNNATSEEATVLVNVGVIPYPDECASAEQVSNGVWDMSTLDATSSTDSYNEDQCQGTYLGEMNKDIWFKYEACESGPITISTCNTISFDSDLVMYEGDCSGLVQVACNGDGSGCANYSSIMEGSVVKGSTYFIRCGGWDAEASGTGTIEISGPEGTCTDPCPQDLNTDGIVNTLDLLEVVSSFGPCQSCSSDFNLDGVVNTLDLLEIVSSFGVCE